jgi:hypothetical protein
MTGVGKKQIEFKRVSLNSPAKKQDGLQDKLDFLFLN